jgi:hypothetical protein
MATSAQPPITVRLAKLELCRNDKGQAHHPIRLTAPPHRAELPKSKAIAISHTQGTFSRQKMVIGHDTAGKKIEMELEKEWNVPDVITRLAELCNENGEKHGHEHAACWIDQLCVSQEPDEIAKRSPPSP